MNSDTEIRSSFHQHFNQPPAHVSRAPGRIELLGNHTDYNEGLVLSAAVDRHVAVATAPRDDGKIELVSSSFPGRAAFWANDLKRDPAAPWADYAKGVLFQLRKRGVHFTGFNGLIHSTIPAGAGLSSSAALEVAVALAVRQWFPYRLTETGLAAAPERDKHGVVPPPGPAERLALARLCHAAENEFVGVRSGLLDQISSLCGRAWHAMSIDCRFVTVEQVPLVGAALVVCETGLKHSLADGAYNELRVSCESAAQKLGAKALRSVDLPTLNANRDCLTQREHECALHVVGEIARVVAAERALRSDDLQQFGQYMFQSHESSRDLLRNSTPELDLLVEMARSHPACLGARLTGGGFGGATVNLVPHHQAGEFVKFMAAEYERRTGRAIHPRVCQPSDGAAP